MCSHARLAVNPYEAAVLLDDAVCGGQAKPRALAFILGCVEGFKDVRQMFWFDSLARVALPSAERILPEGTMECDCM